MSSEPGLVVILSTFNGGEVLRRTLEAYRHLEPPKRKWRIVIANNNSLDDTAEILEYFEEHLPLTTIFVEKPGKNVALNRALETLGDEDDFVILTDDDAVPQPDFMRAWEIVSETYSDAALFAGKIKPYFLEGKPEWLDAFEDEFDVLYAINAREDGLIEASDIFGPNMGVRRSVFAAGLRFNEGIGPSSDDSNYPMGSETEFCVRAEKECNLVSRFSSAPMVEHQIRPHQTKIGFVAGRAFRHGRGYALRNSIALGRFPRIRSALKLGLLKLRMLAGSKRAFWGYHWHRGLYSHQ